MLPFSFLKKEKKIRHCFGWWWWFNTITFPSSQSTMQKQKYWDDGKKGELYRGWQDQKATEKHDPSLLRQPFQCSATVTQWTSPSSWVKGVFCAGWELRRQDHMQLPVMLTNRKSHEIQTETHSLLPFFNLKDMEMSAQRGEGWSNAGHGGRSS